MAALAAPAIAASARPPVTVFAAASMTDALTEAGEVYERRTGTPVRFSFASSSVLSRQIQAGAPAEVFVSADVEWMDAAQKAGAMRPNTRRDIAGNRLVLIAPVGVPTRLKIARGFPLARAIGRGRLAVGDPSHVPAGIYAKAALSWAGVWAQVETSLAPAENVRVALAYVARGEAVLGVVYRTDAIAEPKVRIVDVFPAASHPPIVYPAALTRTAGAESGRFLDWLSGPEGWRILASKGFTRP